MFQPTRTLLLSVTLIAVSASIVEAAPQRGRTRDGRAYRIENGMRLTDYIAELEVTNDDLKRQLNALEDELDEKNRRLDGSAPAAAKVRENDLVKSRSLPPARQSASCNYDSAENPYYGEKVKRIEAEDTIVRLENDLFTARERLARLQKDLEHANSTASTAREQALSAREQADTARAQVDSALAEAVNARSEAQTARLDREATRRELADAGSREAAERARIEALEKSHRETLEAARREREESSRAALAAAEPPAVEHKPAALTNIPPAESLDITPEPEPEAAKAVEPEKPAETLGDAEVAMAKKDLRDQLAKIQELVVQRKNLFDSPKSRGKGVTINLQQLVSKDGRSLDSLRAAVKDLSPSSDIQRIRTGLSEITSILTSDIDVLRRLTK